MRIVMRKTASGPDGTLHEGREYDVPESEARDLIGCQAAAPVARGTKLATAERAIAADPPAKPEKPAGGNRGSRTSRTGAALPRTEPINPE